MQLHETVMNRTETFQAFLSTESTTPIPPTTILFLHSILPSPKFLFDQFAEQKKKDFRNETKYTTLLCTGNMGGTSTGTGLVLVVVVRCPATPVGLWLVGLVWFGLVYVWHTVAHFAFPFGCSRAWCMGQSGGDKGMRGRARERENEGERIQRRVGGGSAPRVNNIFHFLPPGKGSSNGNWPIWI